MVKADRVYLIDEEDVTRLMSNLYNGPRPERVHTLICVCGETADLRKSPKAWNGWQILPHAVCPRCIACGSQSTVDLYPGESQARARFATIVKTMSDTDVNLLVALLGGG